MADFDDIFGKIANLTNEDKVSEGGFTPLAEGIYHLKITDVRFDPFKKGEAFAIDYETDEGQNASETFTINSRDKNGARVKESRLDINVNRLSALIVAVQMAGILSISDLKQGDEHVAEVLLALVDLEFYSKVTHREYEKADGTKAVQVNFTHSKDPIEE